MILRLLIIIGAQVDRGFRTPEWRRSIARMGRKCESVAIST